MHLSPSFWLNLVAPLIFLPVIVWGLCWLLCNVKADDTDWGTRLCIFLAVAIMLVTWISAPIGLYVNGTSPDTRAKDGQVLAKIFHPSP
jgi:hypothetical protein